MTTTDLTVEYGFAAKHRPGAGEPLPHADALTGKKWHPTLREASAAARRSTTGYTYEGIVIIQRWVSPAQEVPSE